MEIMMKEYAPTIITVAVVIALIALVGVLLATDGAVSRAFVNTINGLFSQTGITTP